MARVGREVPEVHLPALQPQLLLRLLEVVRGQAVAEAARAGVEHHPEALAVVLQLDEVVAAAQAAELVLPAPGPRVLRDVPVVLDRDAVALRGAAPLAQRLGAAAHDLLEARLRDRLALRARAQARRAASRSRENSFTRSGVAALARDRGAQGGDAAADVVADRAHGQRAAGGDHAAHGHAVAVVRVRGDRDVEHAGEAARVLDLGPELSSASAKSASVMKMRTSPAVRGQR